MYFCSGLAEVGKKLGLSPEVKVLSCLSPGFRGTVSRGSLRMFPKGTKVCIFVPGFHDSRGIFPKEDFPEEFYPKTEFSSGIFSFTLMSPFVITIGPQRVHLLTSPPYQFNTWYISDMGIRRIMSRLMYRFISIISYLTYKLKLLVKLCVLVKLL